MEKEHSNCHHRPAVIALRAYTCADVWRFGMRKESPFARPLSFPQRFTFIQYGVMYGTEREKLQFMNTLMDGKANTSRVLPPLDRLRIAA